MKKSEDLKQLRSEVTELSKQGQYDRAIEVTDKAFRAAGEEASPEQRKFGEILSILADIYLKKGDSCTARLLYERSLTSLEIASDSTHVDLLPPLEGLVSIRCAEERFVHAEVLNKRILGIQEKALGPDHLDVAATIYNRGMTFKAQGKAGKVEELFQRCLTLREKALGPVHPSVVDTKKALIEIQEGQKQKLAEDELKKALVEEARKAIKDKKKLKSAPQYANVALPSDLPEDERYFVHCPICGNPCLDSSDYSPNPCPHLAFIYAAVDEGYLEYQSPDFEERIKKVKTERLDFSDFPEILQQAGYDNKFLAIAITEGGFDSCGPHGITQIYGFDYNTMVEEIE